MNGETALKFVRSRNAEGEEGTDLAREARQQKVILAIKDKLLSPKVFLNPRIILSLKNAALEALETDIDSGALKVIAKGLFMGRKNISSYVLGDQFLLHPPISRKYDNQYVFIPKTGNWDEIQTWLESLY